MGDMWRSQHMQLVQLIVQNDAAHAVVNKLGTIGLLQFRDLNAGTSFYKRSFVDEVRKCDELARILRTIADEYDGSSISLAERDEALCKELGIDSIDAKIHALEEELAALKEQQELLVKNDNALREQKYVLDLGATIYKKSTGRGAAAEEDAPPTAQMAELMALSEFANVESSLLGQVAGVIKREHAAALERIIFRATRGNAVF